MEIISLANDGRQENNEMNLEQIRDQLSAADKLVVSVMLTPPEIRRWLDIINVAIKDAALLDEFIQACRKSWGVTSESEPSTPSKKEYRITSYGILVGEYKASCEIDALQEMVKDKGYSTLDDLCSATDSDPEDFQVFPIDSGWKSIMKVS